MIREELWDITNRPSTKIKLEILKKVFDVWWSCPSQTGHPPNQNKVQ